MYDDPSNCEIIFLIASIALGLYKFSLATAEAVYVGVYSKYNHECNRVWNWILAACIIDFISVVILCGYMSTFCAGDNDAVRLIWKILQLFHIPQVVIAIWAAHTHFSITDQCYNFWNSDAYELLTFVEFHHGEMWLGVIVLIMSCCCGILYAAFKIFQKLIEK